MKRFKVGEVVMLLPTDADSDRDEDLEKYNWQDCVVVKGPWVDEVGDCHDTNWYDVRAQDGYIFESCGCRLVRKPPPESYEEDEIEQVVTL